MMDKGLTEIEADLPARLSAHLQQGRVTRARDILAETVSCFETLRTSLEQIETVFRKAGQLEQFTDILWAHRDKALKDMFAVGQFMTICTKLGVYERYGPMLQSWIDSDDAPDFTFSEFAHFRYFRKFTAEQKRLFAHAKYRRWKDYSTEGFFRGVDRFACFARISQPLADFLFANRRDKNIAHPVWMNSFRSSEVLKHIFADTRTLLRLDGRRRRLDDSPYPRLPDLSELLDLERAKAVFGRVDVSKGMLLCTLHDGHLILAKRCLLHCVPDRYALGLRDEGPNKIVVGKSGNSHLSAFHAVKLLRGKKTLFMVPDAKRAVDQRSDVKVLGISIPLADGAPTIAFESGCATSWYTIARDGDRFVPTLVAGPSREPMESYDSYKHRWWSFYAARVEELFTGDSSNITLWHFWPKLFHAAAAPASSNVDNYLDDDVGET